MPYKTIVLGVIESHPALHRQLAQSLTLHQTLHQLAISLSRSHAKWIELLATKPVGNPTQLSNQAMELAVQELRDHLQNVSEASGPLSLDSAMEFIRNHTPGES